MKNSLVLFLLMIVVTGTFAQVDTMKNSLDTVPKFYTIDTVPDKPNISNWKTVAMANRSNDHLLIQIGYDKWANQPDSIQTKGFSRSFNVYFMFDFPFKSNPRFSVGIGAGVSSSNIFFENTYIDITGKIANRLSFTNVKDTTHFKKYKLVTTFLEAPIELRFVARPMNAGKSFKAAIGGKVGTMLSATTKGKNLLNASNNVVNSNVTKEKAKRFFNTTRLVGTARLGYGVFSVFGAYQLNSFIKEGFGPDVRPYTIGITISGL